MLNYINLTNARNQLSQLVTKVAEAREQYVVIRGSRPVAVMMSWDEYQSREQQWQDEVRKLMTESKQTFDRWLKANKLKPKKEEDVYQIIDKVAGRN